MVKYANMTKLVYPASGYSLLQNETPMEHCNNSQSEAIIALLKRIVR